MLKERALRIYSLFASLHLCKQDYMPPLSPTKGDLNIWQQKGECLRGGRHKLVSMAAVKQGGGNKTPTTCPCQKVQKRGASPWSCVQHTFTYLQVVQLEAVLIVDEGDRRQRRPLGCVRGPRHAADRPEFLLEQLL